VKHISKRKQ